MAGSSFIKTLVLCALVAAAVGRGIRTCHNPVHCIDDPCYNKICPGYPDATCLANYCGGCFQDWVVDGKLVTCHDCKRVVCPISYCKDKFCPGHLYATCVPNYCDDCNVTFFEEGQRVTCDECNKVQCSVDPCDDAIRPACPAHPEANCMSIYCDGCHALFVDDNGLRVCC